MWLHLSKKKWKVDAITKLQQTKKGHGEPQVDRFSVAPTVGRAFLGYPHATEGKPLFIYQVHVANPERTTDTADYETTHEHLITEQKRFSPMRVESFSSLSSGKCSWGQRKAFTSK